MSQDYDQFEKVFNGTWKHDRDENLEAFMVAVGSTEEEKKMADLKPTFTYTRDGNSIREKTVMAPGMEYEVVMKLGETLDWKDEKNPNFHYKFTPSFKDGVITQNVEPQNGGKRHLVKQSVQGDELTVEMCLPEGSDVVGKRFFKKC